MWENGHANESKVLIFRTERVDAEDSLNKIDQLEHMAERTALLKVFSFFSIFGLHHRFRGIRIGITETEYGIKLGQNLLVYGEAVFDRNSGNVRVESPLYFLTSKNYLIDKLTWSIRKRKSVV